MFVPITPVDKIKINKYLKENEIGEITYLNMCEAIGKKGKITDVEFLEFFTDYVVNDFRLKERIYIKQLTKIVYIIGAFLQDINDSGLNVNEDILEKIRSFGDLYKEYLSRTNSKIDNDFNDNCIGCVLNKVNELYPCEEKSESSSKYINEIQALNDEIKKLKKELEKINKNYVNLQATYNKEHNNIESLDREINSLENKVQEKDNKIVKLNNNIELLNQKINELEIEVSKLIDEKTELEPYREKYNDIVLEVDRLNRAIDESINQDIEKSNIRIKQSKLEKLVYEKLLINSSSIDDLIDFSNKNGIVTSREEIYNILKNIRNKINISDNTFSLSPSYKVVAPNVIEDGTFTINVPKGCKHYDILLVSDFHITEVNDRVLSGFDIINEYCTKNNINLILNLGDFYDGVGVKKATYEDAVQNYKIAEQLITKVSNVPGIYHGILGGNHESNILKFGYDPIKLLTDEREDFLGLGYKHSTIDLKESNKLIGSFDIHHPDVFYFPIDLSDDGIDMAKVENYLKTIYQKQGRNRDNSYIDLFGHVHRNQLNYPGSYCFIPRYFDGSNKKGANHLRIYFDDEKQIKYMVFMPLIGNSKLFKANEIVYQKILTK